MRTLRHAGTGIVGICFAVVSMVGFSTGAAGTDTTVSTPVARADSSCVRNVLADQRFVALAYRVAFERDGDTAGITYWAAKLAYPTSLNYLEVVTQLTNTPERRRLLVRDTYDAVLHRAPSVSESTWYAGWLTSYTASDLTSVLLASEEYLQQTDGTVDDWLTHAYADLMGRDLDPVGRSYWTSLLTGGWSLGDVAYELARTEEHRRMVVDDIYQQVLGRSSDPSGTAYWASKLNALGADRLFAKLAASDEFWQRAQRVMGGTPFPQPPPCPKPIPAWPTTPRVLYNLKDYPSPTRKLAALTFDDGPNPQWTQKILDVLAAKNVKATFFPVGEWAQRYPDLIRRELAAGHRVANHTWDHQSLTSLSAAAQTSEIQRTTDLINGLAGKKVVRCVRPPYGNHSSTTDSIIKSMGLSAILWSRDPGDWRRPGAQAIVNGALDEQYDGGRGIIGLHDGGGDRSQTVAALGPMIDALRARGYEFVTLC